MECLVTALGVWESRGRGPGTRTTPSGKHCLCKAYYLASLIPSCNEGLEVWL